MSENDQHDVPSWLKKANIDLITVNWLVLIEPVILDTACFHCQQAIEKFLKAFLIYRGENVGRTHNLEFLLSECLNYNSEFASFDLRPFAVFAVDIRYPESSINPKIDEVKDYYTIAVAVKKLVEKLISI